MRGDHPSTSHRDFCTTQHPPEDWLKERGERSHSRAPLPLAIGDMIIPNLISHWLSRFKRWVAQQSRSQWVGVSRSFFSQELRHARNCRERDSTQEHVVRSISNLRHFKTKPRHTKASKAYFVCFYTFSGQNYKTANDCFQGYPLKYSYGRSTICWSHF